MSAALGDGNDAHLGNPGLAVQQLLKMKARGLISAAQFLELTAEVAGQDSECPIVLDGHDGSSVSSAARATPATSAAQGPAGGYGQPGGSWSLPKKRPASELAEQVPAKAARVPVSASSGPLAVSFGWSSTSAARFMASRPDIGLAASSAGTRPAATSSAGKPASKEPGSGSSGVAVFEEEDDEEDDSEEDDSEEDDEDDEADGEDEGVWIDGEPQAEAEAAAEAEALAHMQPASKKQKVQEGQRSGPPPPHSH